MPDAPAAATPSARKKLPFSTTHHGKAFPSSHPFIFTSSCDPYALPTQPESSADFESYAVQSIRFMSNNFLCLRNIKGTELSSGRTDMITFSYSSYKILETNSMKENE